MGIDARQVRTLIIRPAITAIGLWSADAEELLMLTAATESQMGEYVRQVGVSSDIGAYGIFQQERSSYEWLWHGILQKASLKASIRLYCGYEAKPPIQRLVSDLALAAIMARLYYADVKAPLPKADNPEDLAAYWKKWYNTELGSGTVEKAVRDYREHCL